MWVIWLNQGLGTIEMQYVDAVLTERRREHSEGLSQPRSQGLSSNRPLGRARRDPGLVWSRATLTIENIREGSSVIRQFVALSFVALRPTLFRIVYIPAFI